MSNPTEKLQKENKELRRQVEVLKAQLKSSAGLANQLQTATEKAVRQTNPTIQKSNVKNEKYEYVDNTEYVKKDLLKSIVLSVIVLSAIFSFYLSGKF